MYADLNLEGHQYLLNDGKWYEVNQDYVNKVQQYYEDATLSDIPMLDYAWKEEKKYNVAVCNKYSDRYCLMKSEKKAAGQKTSRVSGFSLRPTKKRFSVNTCMSDERR